MQWNEIVEKHANDHKDYMNGYKQAVEHLKTDKANLQRHLKCTEAALPDDMKEKLGRDEEAMKQQWGMYGSEFKSMRIAHQKEIDRFFRAQDLGQEISKAQEKSNEKGKNGGR